MSRQNDRKIMRDRKLPGKEQLARYQNFDRIVNDYQLIHKILLKKILIWTGAVLGTAGVVATLTLNTTEGGTATAGVSSDTVVTTPCIIPPIPGKEQPYTTYRISSRNGGTVKHPSGSVLEIPAQAFERRDGHELSDSVEIRYREFHNASEIFLSGIPMDYDSAGVKRTLESAGMLEILAFDKGEPLNLKSDKKIDVVLASHTDDPKYNLYVLDTIAKNWIYNGKDEVLQEEPELVVSKHKNLPSTREFENQVLKPQMADPNKYTFVISYEKNTFPELSVYDKVKFEVTDNSFKPSYYKVNWNKITVDGTDIPGAYLIRLKKADTTISVAAKPVFDKEHYDAALEAFNSHHSAEQKKRQETEKQDNEKLSKVNDELLKVTSAAILTAARNMNEFSVRRGFAIRSLGMHNCDYPVPPMPVFAFTFRPSGNGQVAAGNPADMLDYNSIYLVQKGRNTIFRFTPGAPVNLDPNAQNLMWTVTQNGQIGFFKISDYRRLLSGRANNVTPVLASNQDQALEEIRKFSN